MKRRAGIIAVVLVVVVLFAWHVWSFREPDGSYPTRTIVESLVFGPAVIVTWLGARRLRSGGHKKALQSLRVLVFAICGFILIGHPRAPVAAVAAAVAALIGASSFPIAIWLERRRREERSA